MTVHDLPTTTPSALPTAPAPAPAKAPAPTTAPAPLAGLTITKAEPADAGELLTLQRAAYVTQARLHGDPNLPPLTETLDELRSIVAAAAAPDGSAPRAGCSGMPSSPAAVAALASTPTPASRTLVLVARLEPSARIVGSVRARVDGGTCHIGRLIVAPDLQGRGIGSTLLAEVERIHADEVASFALFTGHLSADNLRLYGRFGYVEVERRQLSDRVIEVHLAKTSLPSGAERGPGR